MIGELFKYASISAAIIGIPLSFILALERNFDDTDDAKNKIRSNFTLMVDYGTGCQYLRPGINGEVTPRVDESGKHICKKVQ